MFVNGVNIVISVAIAVIIACYFFQDTATWMILSALLVSLTMQRRSIRVALYTILALLIMTSVANRLWPSTTLLGSSSLFKAHGLSIIFGGLIAILCGYYLFPRNWYLEFRQGLHPLLTSLENYNKMLSDAIVVSDAKNLAIRHELQLMIKRQLIDDYPNWVYQPGFNPGLRAGYRYFLINLEKVMEILWVMDAYLATSLAQELFKLIQTEFIDSCNKNNELLQLIKTHDFVEFKATDFFSDIQQLEVALKKLIPANLELLDIANEYLLLTAVVRSIKDLRKLLLNLVDALPGRQME